MFEIRVVLHTIFILYKLKKCGSYYTQNTLYINELGYYDTIFFFVTKFSQPIGFYPFVAVVGGFQEAMYSAPLLLGKHVAAVISEKLDW